MTGAGRRVAVGRSCRHRVWVGLGSNLGDLPAALRAAREALEQVATGGFVASPVYETEPWGLEDQPSFLNQVVGLRTDRDPGEFLAVLQHIEREAGRLRSRPRWGPRRLDLDLLCWPGLVLDEPHLVLPHPRLAQRRFVLTPWADVAPDLVVPGLEATVAELLTRCLDDGGVRRLR